MLGALTVGNWHHVLWLKFQKRREWNWNWKTAKSNPTIDLTFIHDSTVDEPHIASNDLQQTTPQMCHRKEQN
jgi:hypothetical protein